jgi:hypothetical protein
MGDRRAAQGNDARILLDGMMRITGCGAQCVAAFGQSQFEQNNSCRNDACGAMLHRSKMLHPGEA